LAAAIATLDEAIKHFPRGYSSLLGMPGWTNSVDASHRASAIRDARWIIVLDDVDEDDGSLYRIGGRVGRELFRGYNQRMTRLDTAADAPAKLQAAPSEAHAVLEARLKEAIVEIAELRARDSLKTQFLANISHDLRTPLTAVITHAEILRDGILGDLSPQQMESVRGIISGGRQLLSQVGEILTYARGAANQLTLVPTRFAIRGVLEEVSSLNESLLKKKLISLSVESEPSLPPVMADREKVAHVVGNLLGNAIEFTPSGGHVWVRAARRHGRWSARHPRSKSATLGSASLPSTMS
jgi:signal transduction histidine kinase